MGSLLVSPPILNVTTPIINEVIDSNELFFLADNICTTITSKLNGDKWLRENGIDWDNIELITGINKSQIADLKNNRWNGKVVELLALVHYLGGSILWHKSDIKTFIK